MATNPQTVLTTPQDAVGTPQTPRAPNPAAAREAVRLYLLNNKGRATLKDIQALAANYGGVVPDSAQAAIDWANQEGTDVTRIPINIQADPLGEADVINLAPPPAPEGTLFEGIPFLEGVYTPEVLGQGLLDATLATGKGLAKAAAGPYDLLVEAAGGVQQAVNYLLTEGGARGAQALGFDPEAIRQVGSARAEDIARTTDTMSVRQALDRIAPTPQGYGAQEFVSELGSSLVVPIVPRLPGLPKPAPPIRAPKISPTAKAKPPATPAPPGAPLTQAEINTALAGMGEKGLTQPTATLDASKKVADFAKDYIKESGAVWGGQSTGVPFSEFFRLNFNAGVLPVEKLEALYQKHGIDTLADFEELVIGARGSVTQSAKNLQLWRTTSAMIPRAAAEEAKALGKNLPGELNNSLWRRMGNAARADLIAELAKTTRDAVSAVAQLPIDMFANTVDNVLASALNPMRYERGLGARNVDFGDAFVLMAQALKPSRRTQGKNLFQQLKDKSPYLNKELLDTYSADIPRPGRVQDAFSKVEKALDVFNFANRFTDSAIRRVAFPAFLRRHANRAGLNYDELVANQQIHTLPDEIMQKAIDDTLKFVFAKKPKEGGELFLGGFSEKLVDLIEATGPIGAATAGFPKFIANAWNYTYRFSPAGAARMFTKKGMEKFDQGDTTAISEAITGTVMFYTALQFLGSEYAGTKWYQARDPQTGKEFDLRPYFPIGGAHLFLADLVRRAPEELGGDGTFDKAYTAADVIQGLSGAQFRAGAGEYLVDTAIEDVRSAAEGFVSGEEGKLWGGIGKALGSFIGGLVPFGGTVSDVVAQIDPEQQKMRDTSFSPFWGQALREIPYAQSEILGLPESQYVGREGPMTREDPVLRQITGAAFRPAPTDIEKEFGELGINQYRLYTKTGVPAVDSRVKEVIGQLVGDPASKYYANKFLTHPEYLTADRLTKTDIIEKYYTAVREEANRIVDEENPAYPLLRQYRSLDRENKIRANRETKSRIGISVTALAKQLTESPLIQTKDQFDALPVGTKYTDPGDYKVYTKK